MGPPPGSVRGPAEVRTLSRSATTVSLLRSHRLRQRGFAAASRWLGAYRRPLWLIGDGRSGTTWAGNLLTAGGRVRIAFEPFHPGNNPAFAGATLHEYRRPESDDPSLEREFARIFAGRVTSHWIDREWSPALHDDYLIKDVFACLVAKWALRRNAHVRPILLIRNPFAVAKSKRSQHPGWQWLTDVGAVLTDERLVADHLEPQAGLIEEVSARGDLLLNHIANWAIIHHVVLRQFSQGELPIIAYEDLLVDPSAGLAPAREAYPGLGSATGADLAAKSGQISRVARAEDVARQRANVRNAWREGLEPSEIHEGRRILDAFQLDGLYEEQWRLRRNALDHLFGE